MFLITVYHPPASPVVLNCLTADIDRDQENRNLHPDDFVATPSRGSHGTRTGTPLTPRRPCSQMRSRPPSRIEEERAVPDPVGRAYRGDGDRPEYGRGGNATPRAYRPIRRRTGGERVRRNSLERPRITVRSRWMAVRRLERPAAVRERSVTISFWQKEVQSPLGTKPGTM